MIINLANRWIFPICPPALWRAACLIRRHVRHLVTDQSSLRTTARFLFTAFPGADFRARATLVRQFYAISLAVDCPHSQHEMLEVAAAILSLPEGVPGCIVEAGCYKGGSAAKLSLVAALAGRDLVLFDSFEGLPENDEEHYTTAASDSGAGTKVYKFAAGNYAGSLDEVKVTIRRHGDLSRCRFVKGWFSDTMPHFTDAVCVAYIDVDLVTSTKDCIGNLRRVLRPEGRIFSQDGHLVRICELFTDCRYWIEEVGCRPPRIDGLGVKRMVSIRFTD